MKVPQRLLLSLVVLAAAVDALPGRVLDYFNPFPNEAFSQECHLSGLVSQNVDGAMGAVLAACDNSFTKTCEDSKNSTNHCYNHAGCLEFDDVRKNGTEKMHWRLSVNHRGSSGAKNVTLSKASCIAGLSQVVLGKCFRGGKVTFLDHNEKYWGFA